MLIPPALPWVGSEFSQDVRDVALGHGGKTHHDRVPGVTLEQEHESFLPN